MTRQIRRVLQVGDLHLATSKLQDQTPVITWLGRLIAEREIDLVIVAGDLTGSRQSPHLSRPVERNALLDFLAPLVAEGVEVLAYPGNHDVEADWAFLPRLGVTWVTTPQTVTYLGLLVHVLPYPGRGWAAMQGNMTRQEVTERVGGALRAVCACFARDGLGPSILTAHCATTGAKTSSGYAMIGGDVELSESDLLASGAAVVLCNHIHKPQHNGRVIHVGSPWPVTAAEEETKRVVIYDVETGEIESVPTPCVQRATVDATWADGTWDVEPQNFTERHRVRLRLFYPEGDAINVDAARSICDGAGSVKVERCPERTERQRAPEVVAAHTLAARYLAFEASEGRTPDDREIAMMEGMTS